MAVQVDHYTYEIKPNYSDSQQAQPWALLLIMHFSQPNTLDIPSKDDAFKPQKNKNSSSTGLYSDDVAIQTTKILIRSDIMRASVRTSKRDRIGSASLELVPGQYEYDKVLCPGDHAFLWMHNDIAQLQAVVDAIKANKAANFFNSGLKFYGRIESVREMFNTSDDGTKTIRYNVNLKSFSELNSQIYFNPYLHNTDPDIYAFYAQLSKNYSEMFNKKSLVTPQEALKFLLKIFVGSGPDKKAKGSNEVQRSPNNAYMIPKSVGQVLGQVASSKGARLTYSDILNTLIGVQRYTTAENQFKGEDTVYKGLVPIISDATIQSRQRECPEELKGIIPALPDLFNNHSLLSILDSLLNQSLNELFLTLRADEKGNIMPTMVARQIPFTTDRFFKVFPNSDATKFLKLPRWRINPGLRIGSYNIGTSDVMRVNFVQFYGSLFNSNVSAAEAMASQSSENNFKEDRLDILRNGGRNAIINSNVLVDTQAGSIVPEKVQEYATLVADWYMNGHLKLTGSITLPGIAEPICVGDNLEFDDKVFHIEEVSHDYAMDGIYKRFSTSLALVNGVKTDGSYAYTGAQNPNVQNEQYGSTSEINTKTNEVTENTDAKDPISALISNINLPDFAKKLLG